MLIRFWCDSNISFPRGLHKSDSSVFLYVLFGAGGDASFAPQANLVSFNLIDVSSPAFKNIFDFFKGWVGGYIIYSEYSHIMSLQKLYKFSPDTVLISNNFR